MASAFNLLPISSSTRDLLLYEFGKAEMQRLGFSDYNEYLDYLEFKRLKEIRKAPR